MENRNNNNNQPNTNIQNNNRRPDNRPRPQGQEKKPLPGNNFHNRNYNQNNQPGSFKPRDQRPAERPAAEGQNKEKTDQQQRFTQQDRFPKNNPPRQFHESMNRVVKTKREETVEDIQADIERVDKDIQFEIKQIKSIKLGL